MPERFEAVRIKENVYWVGAVDWAVRDFHGYSTHRGSTYNAYLIVDEKVTLIDTVKKNFKHEMMSRIASIIDPARIDYIVSNHAEMDHTGALPETIAEVNPEKVFASAKGAAALNEHFHLDYPFTVVKNGDSLPLGACSLQFIETAMLHWPDSMFSFIPEHRLLFSQDAFGMHLASSCRFDDEVPRDILEYESAKYYANILWPYATLIGKLFEKLDPLNLELDMIAPDHGPVWRSSPAFIIDQYRKWINPSPPPKVVIIYDTMWQSTGLMANAIAEGVERAGVNLKVNHMGGCHRSDVVTELLDAGALIAGSPTINNMIFPTMADVLTYLKGLKPKHLIGAIFGSYGWSGESLRQLNDYMSSMNIPLHGEIRCKYVPDRQILDQCIQLGMTIGAMVKGVKS